MASPRALLTAALMMTLVVGCGDSGDDDDDSDAGPVDSGPPAPLMSDIFGPCNQTSDCLEAQSRDDVLCRPASSGYAFGSCSRRCGSCSAGGTNHICLDDDALAVAVSGIPRGLGNTCHRLCEFSLDCGDGNVCVEGSGGTVGPWLFVDDGMASNTCIAWSCGEGADCGPTAVCGPGGTCIAPEDMPTGTAEIGEACGADGVCASGLCDTGQWMTDIVGGMITPISQPVCAANCILPPSYNGVNFWDTASGGTSLPSGSCGADAVCFPRFGFYFFVRQMDGTNTGILRTIAQVSRGSPGRCFGGCTNDGECEANQVCALEFVNSNNLDESVSVDRGVCVPNPDM